MSIKGSDWKWLHDSLDRGDLAGVRAAAAGLPAVPLPEALRIVLLVRVEEPHRFERAAVRWLGRYALEHRTATVEDIRHAAGAFERLRHDPEGALPDLEALTVG